MSCLRVPALTWRVGGQLCRYVKDSTLWACLAVMALADKELSTAEVAFAAIDEVAKLQVPLAFLLEHVCVCVFVGVVLEQR